MLFVFNGLPLKMSLAADVKKNWLFRIIGISSRSYLLCFGEG
jgi:hypothetical protein